MSKRNMIILYNKYIAGCIYYIIYNADENFTKKKKENK